nr:ribonuclease H-like domain-containing protein [Tanacetum cinerariifolium]
MDNYAKHMKDLVENKPRTKKDKEIRMNGRLDFSNALADLVASISVMPLSMYKRLGMGKLKPINMALEQGATLLSDPEELDEPGEAFPLPVIEFPLAEEVPTASEESCHCQKKKEATTLKIALLVKLRRNCQSKSDDSYANTASTTTTDTASDETGKKKGRTVTLTAEDMQKRKNDVKARTTLLLSFPDEQQLRFSKYKTAQELWAAILKTFGGNEATKKTKKNLLKQQYEIEHDDLNQKFLTSLAPEWLMHMIIWRNRSDLDTMSLDDLYNHLKGSQKPRQRKERQL